MGSYRSQRRTAAEAVAMLAEARAQQNAAIAQRVERFERNTQMVAMALACVVPLAKAVGAALGVMAKAVGAAW